MKVMKILLAVCIMTNSLLAASIYITGSGDWSNGATWSTGTVPPTTSADELKLFKNVSDTSGDGYVITITTNVGNYNSGSCKISTVRDTTLLISDGGFLGNNKEIHAGKADASGNGTDNGYIVQTGGTIQNDGKLFLGYKALAAGTNGGVYTISGGTLTGSGKIYIAAGGADGSKGKFKVVGSAATISLGGEMYIANDSSSTSGNTGDGTLEFNVVNGAVSKIQVLKTIIDSQNEAAAVATLLISGTGSAPTADIVLVENTGDSSVTGVFDNAAEGAIFNVGGVNMTLTYKYVAGNDGIANDIALVIPEPATLALLGLGLLSFRRK